MDGCVWEVADKAAELAERTQDYRGLRDSALIRVMSDGMLRVAEASALDVEDIEFKPNGFGKVTIRESKTDQTGEGADVPIGPPTVAAVKAWLELAGIESGALFLSERGRAAGKRLTPKACHFVYIGCDA